MDEYSDFQMAVPALPSKKNSGGKDFWGINSPSSRTLGHAESINLNGGPRLSKDYFQHTLFDPGNIVPPPPHPILTNNDEEKHSVGSRLANYNLGLIKTPLGKQDIPINNLPSSRNKGGTNNNLLMGEEDKYAALRALVDFRDEENPTEVSIIEKSKTKMPFETPIQENGGDEDFSDFGDFQSFSNTFTCSSRQPIPVSSQSYNTPLSGYSKTDILKPDSGHFVSSIPSVGGHKNFNTTEQSCKNEISFKQFDAPGNDFGNISEIILSNDSRTSAKRNSSLDDITFPVVLPSELQTNNHVLFIDQFDFSPSKDKSESPNTLLDDNHSSNSLASNYRPKEDVAIPCFIKTSLIGCDNNSCSDIESFRSASLMETNVEDMEYIHSTDKNKTDISPETRSIASLDLGTYCTYEITDSKISSSENNKQGLQGYQLPINVELQRTEIRDLFNDERTTDENPADKYQCFREDLQLETISHILNWSKCLHSIKEILVVVDAVLKEVSNNDVISEMVLHEKGENFVKGLAEIYHVFNRVQLSHAQLETSRAFDAIFYEIQKLWESICSNFVGTYAVELLSNTRASNKYSLGDNRICRICLNHVEENDQLNHMEHEKVLYHFGCANLWINNVEPNLPLDKL